MSIKVINIGNDWLQQIAEALGELVPTEWKHIALKVHFGRSKRGRAGVLPTWVRPTVQLLEGRGCTVVPVDTNTLYGGERHNTQEHLALAHKHGFPDAQILDGPPLYFDSHIAIPQDLQAFDGVIHFAHLTGHRVVGFAGAIKGVGMGLAHQATKLWVHQGGKPKFRADRCTACGKCTEICPLGHLSPERLLLGCAACAECVGKCKAVTFSFGGTQAVAQRLAKAALVIDEAMSMVHVVVGVDITRLCDCMGDARDMPLGDVGVWVSDDLVGIDETSMRATWPLMGKYYSAVRWGASTQYAKAWRSHR